MFLKYTEVKSQTVIALNRDQIVAVFESLDGEFKGKTVLNLVNGSVAVEEDILTVLGQLSAV
jgi:hypothetical protein